MVEPVRHRQTKEAANRYVQPTATASHLDSTQSPPRKRTSVVGWGGPTPGVSKRQQILKPTTGIWCNNPAWAAGEGPKPRRKACQPDNMRRSTDARETPSRRVDAWFIKIAAPRSIWAQS